MTRPYRRLGIQELEELAKRGWSDAEDLGLIQEELEERRTDRSIRLKSQIEARRLQLASIPADELNSQATGLEDPSHVSSGFDAQIALSADTDSAAVGPDLDPWVKKPAKRITRPGQPGQPQRPPRREPKQKDHPNFTETGDLAKDLSAILEIHVDELKQLAAGSVITVRGGERASQTGGQYIYVFSLIDDVRLKDDTPVQVIVSGKPVGGTVVSVSPSKLKIAVDEDLGEYVEQAQIRTDQSFLMAKLKEAIDRVTKGEQTFSREMAEKVLGRKMPSVGIGEPRGDLSAYELNQDQSTALRKSLGTDVLYLWGPPGTGKTYALAEVILEHYSRGEKILLASNTNLAVDLLLRKVCEGLEQANDAGFEAGAVIRTGVIQDGQLEERFGDRVDLERVATRLSAELVAEKEKTEEALRDVLPLIEAGQSIIAAFDERDQVRQEQKKSHQRVELAALEHDRAAKKLNDVLKARPRLHAEVEKAEKSSGLQNFFAARNKENLRGRLNRLDAQEKELRRVAEAAEREKPAATAQQSRLDDRECELSKRLEDKSLSQERNNVAHLEAKAAPYRQRIGEIEEKLRELKSEIEKNSRIIAATATQTYLRPQRFAAFDVVILDEASMLTLPVVFYVAGLSTKRVVVTGDFRQLAPIVQTKFPLVEKWLGKDVFDYSGIQRAVAEKKTPPQLVQLKTQYRMCDEICQVVNKPFYDGSLQTGNRGSAINGGVPAPEPYRGSLTIVDTSAEWPFANLRPGTYSRYNLIHALAIRAMCVELQKSGFISDRGAVGVVTPYSAQADVMKGLLDELGLSDVEAGTVHRFQGNEKRMIIIDIPDGPGVARIGQFLAANRIDESGAKLFNVAFSRPKDHLVVFANLTYLEDMLPTDSFLRRMLYDVQERGIVLDAHECLTISEADLASRGPGFLAGEIELDDEKMLVVTHRDFDRYLLRDLEAAEESIVIFSGFCTERRVAALSQVLRHKYSQGIKVRCVTRPTDRQGGIPADVVQRGLDGLIGLGASVDLRQSIHEKVVVVDGRICWIGSLNPLSHSGRSDEIMARAESPALCAKVSRLVSTSFKSPAEEESTLATLADRENPECGGCGGLSVFATGRNGAYFHCAAKCGWSENRDGRGRRTHRRPATGPGSTESKQCPKCGRNMVIRSGRNGRFWGCSGYPDNCRRTSQL